MSDGYWNEINLCLVIIHSFNLINCFIVVRDVEPIQGTLGANTGIHTSHITLHSYRHGAKLFFLCFIFI